MSNGGGCGTTAPPTPDPATVLEAVGLIRAHLVNIQADVDRLETFRLRIAYPAVETSPENRGMSDEMSKIAVPYPDGLLGELTAIVDNAAAISAVFHQTRNQLVEVVFGEDGSE